MISVVAFLVARCLLRLLRGISLFLFSLVTLLRNSVEMVLIERGGVYVIVPIPTTQTPHGVHPY